MLRVKMPVKTTLLIPIFAHTTVLSKLNGSVYLPSLPFYRVTFAITVAFNFVSTDVNVNELFLTANLDENLRCGAEKQRRSRILNI